MDCQKPAAGIQSIIPLGNYHNPKCAGKILIIRTVFFIFYLRDKYMSQLVVFLKLQQPFKIVGLISFNAKPFHHVQNHIVIVSADLVTGVFFCPEVACDTEPFGMREHHGRRGILHTLGNGNMSMKPLPISAVKVDKSTHGVEQSPGNRKSQSQSACKTAAAGIRLIKIIAHLRELRSRHADSGIINVYDQIDAVVFTSITNADVDAAFLRKLNRVFQKNFKNMRNFFRISNQNGWGSWIKVKDHLQLMLAVLHGGHGNNIIEDGSDHVRFFCRSQRAFYDLSVIQHVVDLIGQALACQLDGLHVSADSRRNIFFQYDFAESEHHIDGSPQFMGYVGQKFCILPSGSFQLCQCTVIYVPGFLPSVDPVSCNRDSA